MPSGRPFSCAAIGSEMPGSPHRFDSGVYAKFCHRLANQSYTEGLVLVVRYSLVPTLGVGSAVMGVRMMSQRWKKLPNAHQDRKSVV